MSNLDEKVDKLEAAVDPNTVISVGGFSFTPAKLMIAGGIVSTILGGLYGAFEFYKDYTDMKQQIQEYVAPDLSAIQERITKMEQRVDNAVVMVDESGDIIRDVRVDLKGDIDSLQADLDAADRRGRELDKEVRGFVGVTDREMSTRLRTIERETDAKLKELEKKVDEKIQKAWENPLAK
jgi:tetrahydromethanopterin S-methyltransferase subunit B